MPVVTNRSTLSASQARQNEALRLRRLGMSFFEIANRLGYANTGAASNARRAAERRERFNNDFVTTPNREVRRTTRVATRRTVPTATRTFGVEAEFFGITPMVAIQALASVGITATYEGYTHAVMTNWKIVTDVSVTALGTGTGRGLELVSPILQGEAGLEQMAKALNALRNAGALVNKTCGLHVHVGMDGLNGAQINKVVEFYASNENNINQLVSPSRRGNSFCKLLSRRGNLEMTNFNQLRNMVTPLSPSSNRVNTEIARLAQGTNRYYTVNVSAYAKYGTVEFRQHQGTLNGTKATTWVKFLLGLIETAVVADQPVAFTTLSEMADGLSLRGDTKRRLVSRATALANRNN